MLSVILIWIYIILICTMLGLLLMIPAGKILGYRPKDSIAVLLAGLAGATVYAQVYSLFAGLGLWADAILTVICLAGVILFRKSIYSLIGTVRKDLRISGGRIAAVLVIFILMAYGSSHGIIHYDTSLYHAQAIHWLETYGLVPGLGNLHCRLAYNSAAFPLTALFSFAWLGGQSYHVTAGYCAFLLALECLKISDHIKNRNFTPALFARVMAVYYLFMIFDEMVSPASDYYMVCLAFILVIRWVSLTEEGNETPAPYAMLALLSCMIVTVKLSGVMLVLCALPPGIWYLRKKQWGKFLACIGSGAVIILPYLIRNVIISGWLLYPSTSIDLFDPDWKIPEGAAQYDYKEIQVYGRGYTDVSAYSDPISAWFKNWFMSQSVMDRLFIAAAIVGVICFVIKCSYYGYILCRKKKAQTVPSEMFMEAVISICFLFWLFTSPLMRYGCLYVYLTDALVWGKAVERLSRRKPAQILVLAFLSLFILYKGAITATDVVREYRPDTWVRQQDYPEFEVTSYNVNGIDIYIPVEGDQTGYYAFPSSPWEMDIELRGTDIRSGFRSLSTEK